MSKKKRTHTHAQNQKNTTASDKLAAKKAAVLGTEKKKPPVIPIAIILCAVLIAGGIISYAMKNGTASRQAVSTAGTSSGVAVSEAPAAETQAASEDVLQAAATEVSDVVSYPETMFMDGVAKYFKHEHGDMTIKYFVMKSVDGVIRAAFDACDVCWPAGKGYVQDGDYMVCRNCGRRFDSTSINEIKGGCNPAPLERTMKDGAVFIKLEKILEGQGYFDFSQHT